MAGSSDGFFRRKDAPRVTVDAWVRDSKGRLLLVRRGRPPFEGRWALPGGFLEWNEETETCCARETEEETGVAVEVGRLLGVYSDPRRDPRGHTVTVLYEATPSSGRAKGGDDAAEARWFTGSELETLEFAFDHGEIVREQWARRARGPRTRKPGRRSPRRKSRPAGPSRRARRGGAPG
jgi:8-oxo-dGTP diphosphatase